jgi:oligopeptide/dipeptide ABC transporter ATP-binding protein
MARPSHVGLRRMNTSMPERRSNDVEPGDDDILVLKGLSKRFPVTSGIMRRKVAEVHAVDAIDVTIRRGETLGLVGESGSGKTTLGRTILMVEPPTSGSIIYDGTDLAQLTAPNMRPYRRRIQMVFQDPYSSLNPRMRVRDALAEPLKIHGLAHGAQERTDQVNQLLELVGLPRDARDRYPHEFSGGQRQRISIARALAVRPEFIIADEAVSALDVSIQAQILSLFEDMRDRLGLTYLFVSHDLAVIRHVATRVAVMYLGRIVEIADRDAMFHKPAHPYTVSLLASAPIPDPIAERRRHRVKVIGEVPSPMKRPSGCAFHPRCPVAIDRCRHETPPLQDLQPGHQSACWRAGEVADGLKIA